MALEIVIFLVTAVSAVLGVASRMRSGRPLDQIGRRGGLWFDHAVDYPVESRPSEDERDAPLPRRPLRGRPQ